ncbi:Phosphatase kdsC [Candidatus Koribacter versatilis Ellin345]|uniref:Phosphatase kdsC n=1 Tax=Koribacter versatilis (strain Ellin345) TaxID=204669 RepID=Q1IMQ7_KORVE|nr:HAD family hydrolase [Candidatus Koribacter versatilis]ABF41843.1 Phosphatase kdsC [Candidatus Koribacter versatilis Ellin345]
MIEIKAIAMDVDGVLTDGGVWWGPNGEEWKRFCFADIMGLSLAHKAGMKLALISGEDSPLVDRMAAKFAGTAVFKPCKDKRTALEQFIQSNGLAPTNVCFIGDDINDLGALEIAGLPCAPADARPAVLAKCRLVANARGGNGAVREIIDRILAAQSAGG